MLIKKRMIIFLLLAIYFITAYALFDYFGISCVFVSLFGIPCPGCGMTHALFAVLNMDFVEAAKQNILIFFMPYVFMYILFDFKGKIHNFLLIIIAITAILNWVIKIIYF